VLSWLGLVATILASVWALVSGWLAIGAVVRRRAFDRRQKEFVVPPIGQRVLLIRPCAGDELELERCLASAAAAKHSFPLDVVFGVSTDDDTAVPAIERAIATLEHAGLNAQLAVYPPAGPNRKAATIAGAVEQLKDDYALVINADTNIDLTGYDLDQMVGRLIADEACGAVWSPFAEFNAKPKLGTRCSIAMMGGALTAFSVLAGLSPRSLSGKFWAIKIAAMEASGGFEALTQRLGEDFEMGTRLHGAGFAVIPAPQTARAVSPPLGLIEAVVRVARWMVVVRSQRPILMPAYPLLFASTPLNVALAGLGALWDPRVAFSAMGLAIAARLLVAATAEIYSGRGWGPVRMVVDSILSDWLILTAWPLAWTRRRVVWRGQTLRVDSAGKLHALSEAKN
jgi:ceramide glucosyltransferase